MDKNEFGQRLLEWEITTSIKYLDIIWLLVNADGDDSISVREWSRFLGGKSIEGHYKRVKLKVMQKPIREIEQMLDFQLKTMETFNKEPDDRGKKRVEFLQIDGPVISRTKTMTPRRPTVDGKRFTAASRRTLVAPYGMFGPRVTHRDLQTDLQNVEVPDTPILSKPPKSPMHAMQSPIHGGNKNVFLPSSDRTPKVVISPRPTIIGHQIGIQVPENQPSSPLFTNVKPKAKKTRKAKNKTRRAKHTVTGLASRDEEFSPSQEMATQIQMLSQRIALGQGLPPQAPTTRHFRRPGQTNPAELSKSNRRPNSEWSAFNVGRDNFNMSKVRVDYNRSMRLRMPCSGKDEAAHNEQWSAYQKKKNNPPPSRHDDASQYQSAVLDLVTSNSTRYASEEFSQMFDRQCSDYDKLIQSIYRQQQQLNSSESNLGKTF